ncbi:MAG: hypothetical protein AB1695_12595 [Stygiobacter sp.]
MNIDKIEKKNKLLENIEFLELKKELAFQKAIKEHIYKLHMINNLKKMLKKEK